MSTNKEATMAKRYLNWLKDPHHTNDSMVNQLDLGIRSFIGKTEDIEQLKVGMCSHQAILEREMGKKDPEMYCRKCGLSTGIGVVRCNDFLVLRNPLCNGPICGNCIKDGGDVFYLAFKKGSNKYTNLLKNRNKITEDFDKVDTLLSQLKEGLVRLIAIEAIEEVENKDNRGAL